MEMQITVLYVGSSLLAPLRNAEREINRQGIDLRVVTWNFGAAFAEDEWQAIESDLSAAQVLFVIHVMDGENAARLLPLLDRFREQHQAVVVINCMPDLMKRTRMGRLDLGRLSGGSSRKGAKAQSQNASARSTKSDEA